jgi:hypothetical protein
MKPFISCIPLLSYYDSLIFVTQGDSTVAHFHDKYFIYCKKSDARSLILKIYNTTFFPVKTFFKRVFALFERILLLFPTSIRLFFEYKWVKNKMTKNINKEMLKVLLNEIYLCCVS